MHINKIWGFYKYNKDTIFTKTYVRDREIFYMYSSKYYKLKNSRNTLDMLDFRVEF